MDPERWPTWRRDLAVVVACLALGWWGMRGEPVPLLGLVDLGVHELGHLLCYVIRPGELVTAAAGSVVQVAAPVALAAYFLVGRCDRAGGAVCAAWAATSALDASRYVADAPHERLALLGGDHDWAFFFSAEGIDAMHLAGTVADVVSTFGWLLYGASFVIALWPLTSWLDEPRQAGRPEPTRSRAVP